MEKKILQISQTTKERIDSNIVGIVLPLVFGHNKDPLTDAFD